MSAPTIDLSTPKETRHLAAELAPLLGPGDLVVLTGPLGSGKTFFTRALCRALGLPRDVRVPSPTFTLVHEHETTPPLSHADLYRLSTPEQVHQLGLAAERDAGRVLVVEWGEPFIELLGGDALVIRFSLNPRQAEVSASGPRSQATLQALSQARTIG